jgi:hypothetical protein
MTRPLLKGFGVAKEILRRNELQLQKLHGVGCSGV